MATDRPTPAEPSAVGRPLIIGCGALVADLRAVLDAEGLRSAFEVVYLPANLHNRPERIVESIEGVLIERGLLDGSAPVRHLAFPHPGVFLAYADCGTGGMLDRWLERHPGIRRLPGAHCYEFLAGTETFRALHDAEPGTFYLTDFLARNFEPLVWVGLGLDRHPALRDAYFGNYSRLVLLSQSSDPGLVVGAGLAADRLGLEFSHHHVGREPLHDALAPLHELVPAGLVSISRSHRSR
jgi:hypothetical protein